MILMGLFSYLKLKRLAAEDVAEVSIETKKTNVSFVKMGFTKILIIIDWRVEKRFSPVKNVRQENTHRRSKNWVILRLCQKYS
jgi:hypothetical protein